MPHRGTSEGEGFLLLSTAEPRRFPLRRAAGLRARRRLPCETASPVRCPSPCQRPRVPLPPRGATPLVQAIVGGAGSQEGGTRGLVNARLKVGPARRPHAHFWDAGRPLWVAETAAGEGPGTPVRPLRLYLPLALPSPRTSADTSGGPRGNCSGEEMSSRRGSVSCPERAHPEL